MFGISDHLPVRAKLNLFGYITLEQAQAAVDMVGQRLLHVKKADLKEVVTFVVDFFKSMCLYDKNEVICP